MTTLKLKVVIRVEASSVITFGNVNLFFAAAVVRNFNVDLGISVAAVRISVAIINIGSQYISTNWCSTRARLGSKGCLLISSDFYLWAIGMAVVISGKLYFGVVVVAVMSVRAVTVFFCVDSNVVFSAARTAFTVLFVDSDLFLVVSSTILAAWKSGRNRRVLGFVTFPSDALVGLSIYPDASSFFSSVAPVRRREDTERDRNSGVKVQIDESEGVFSRMPSEPLKVTNRKEDKKRLLLQGRGERERER